MRKYVIFLTFIAFYAVGMIQYVLSLHNHIVSLVLSIVVGMIGAAVAFYIDRRMD